MIFKIVAIALVATILSLVLKKQNPEYVLYIGIATGIIIFFMICDQIEIVIEAIKDIANKVNLNNAYIKIIFKIIGISYITEFGSQLCKDSGQGAISMKIEFAGKILILVVSLPVLMTLLDLLTSLLA